MEVEKRKWHIEKGINIGHILTTIALVIGFFSWANQQDRRITVLEVQQQNTVQMGKDIKDQLNELSRKIDRLIERESLK